AAPPLSIGSLGLLAEVSSIWKQRWSKQTLVKVRIPKKKKKDTARMAMDRIAKQRRTRGTLVRAHGVAADVAHPFYEQLNRSLEERNLDGFAEQQAFPRLCVEDGASESGAGAELPFAADWVFRGDRRRSGQRIRWRCAVFLGWDRPR